MEVSSPQDDTRSSQGILIRRVSIGDLKSKRKIARKKRNQVRHCGRWLSARKRIDSLPVAFLFSFFSVLFSCPFSTFPANAVQRSCGKVSNCHASLLLTNLLGKRLRFFQR
jgi:hypothetical protein